ncbi:MAG: hypothetical protein DRI75_06685 [Bacteroidetes bacterium]|nr:MAG: hypothetical protein DRI75_06685 [Bacteroidota bacterium]
MNIKKIALLLTLQPIKHTIMRFIYSILCLSFLFVACQPAPDNSANEAFEKNSKTVLSLLEGFQNESHDYDILYSKDVVVADNGFGSTRDSLNLDDIKASDKMNWDALDFKLLTDPDLLPGVNAETKLADGSVRYYGTWEVTRTATDSTEAKSGELRIYQSFDFDADGKIIFQQGYGDFSGLIRYLFSSDDDDKTEE